MAPVGPDRTSEARQVVARLQPDQCLAGIGCAARRRPRAPIRLSGTLRDVRFVSRPGCRSCRHPRHGVSCTDRLSIQPVGRASQPSTHFGVFATYKTSAKSLCEVFHIVIATARRRCCAWRGVAILAAQENMKSSAVSVPPKSTRVTVSSEIIVLMTVSEPLNAMSRSPKSATPATWNSILSSPWRKSFTKSCPNASTNTKVSLPPVAKSTRNPSPHIRSVALRPLMSRSSPPWAKPDMVSASPTRVLETVPVPVLLPPVSTSSPPWAEPDMVPPSLRRRLETLPLPLLSPPVSTSSPPWAELAPSPARVLETMPVPLLLRPVSTSAPPWAELDLSPTRLLVTLQLTLLSPTVRLSSLVC